MGEKDGGYREKDGTHGPYMERPRVRGNNASRHRHDRSAVATAAMTGPDLAFEEEARGSGARVVAGVDEVGRGPWAGPVVACAAVLTIPPPGGLDDSKALKPARREALAVALRDIDHAFGIVDVPELDALGVGRATVVAMARAVAGLGTAPDMLLIDGNDPTAWAPCPARTIVRGDSRSASIAAASVLAKVRRDAVMADLADRHPGYGWETNMGYGTRAHADALARLGVTEHHRRSFAPIRALLRGSD